MIRTVTAGMGLALILAAYSCSDSKTTSGPNGKKLFATNCALCHGHSGQGGPMNLGPSYKGIAQHWDTDKLVEYIADPKAFAAKVDRLGKREMTAVADSVTAQERQALAEYALTLMD
jgi:mono/diheme cytochrome c family protein